MFYTSFSPNDDRFGFRTSGTFKCAYDSERVVLIAILASVLVCIIGSVICFALSYEMLFTPVDMDKTIHAIEQGHRDFFGFNTLEYGLLVTLMFILLCMAAIGVIAFFVAFAVLRTGRICAFKADEKHMVITRQGRNPKTTVFYYDDVITVDCRERRFHFIGGLNITVYTKNKWHEFRCIHSHSSRADGISGTPFNIICERAGLVKRPQQWI